MRIHVSVVIPAYNATKTIGDGLESFARQSFPAAEVEIIIVDDGSTDAAAQGDRSENAEYIYGKKKLREIDRRIHYLTKRLETDRKSVV